MSVDKTTDGKVIWALRLYNKHGGYSPEMVRRDTLPVLPGERQGYVRVEEYEELLQQQSGPVALPERKNYDNRSFQASCEATGWNACLDEIAKLGPLYTHADPNVRWKAVADEQMQVITGLRAQLEQQRAEFANAQAVEHCKWAALVDDLDAAMSSTSPVAVPLETSQQCINEVSKVFHDILRGVRHKGWTVGTDIVARIEALLKVRL
ncbi:hypothetical protein P6F34_gp28 [Pseudomonas phage MiCath]|uniref:Uncharacterized protein n=1 Tax=Pseudomonas phage MiCath TaxID=3003729 RepID=A0AAE9VFD2_9CAUD|nr:hypothetical protein P6F34_gp28 [Pseudomonas phage MiCath]WAX22381.1 hypothetical protein [Pseudomonas phage MiCath]